MNRVAPGLLVVLGLLFLPAGAHAAVQSVVWNFYDEATGEPYPENAVSIIENGTAAVPFGITGYLEIEADLEPFMAVDGEIYFIPDPQSGERQLAGYASEIVFEQEGVYELDVYEYVLAPNRTPLQRLLAWFFPVAHAAPPGWMYLETIRFIVTEAPPPAPPCCSSVLFLPGIQGSALKEGSDVLWPSSLLSDDVARLALTEEGESVNDVKVAGVLNNFVPGVDVYGGFADFMDSLSQDEGDGTIREWAPFAYDWRFSLEKTLEEGVMREGEEEAVFLVDEVHRLAQDSKTGKVTLVAHSMGGLLGKALIKKLEEEGNENLIDSFVMVGTPQLGTPEALAALLHGREMLEMELFVRSHVFRSVSRNMESAYTLLPSDTYFDTPGIAAPISFSESADFTEDWRNRWGITIDTPSELSEFLLGTGVSRSRPSETNLSQPEVLQSSVLANAASFHDALDAYEFPSNIRVVQVAGWGLPTLKGLEYKKKHIFFDGYEPYFTMEGDQTVVYSSAVSSDAETYFFNLTTYNSLPDTSNHQHKDIISALPIKSLLVSVLKGDEISNQFLLTSKPDPGSLEDQLVISTKSPVVLGVSDSNGNYTGVVSGQDLGSETLEVIEEIPGSTFIASGDDQFIFLPKEGNYVFAFEGTGTGPATVETATFSDDVMNVVATYSDIPVTPQTKGSFTVSAIAPTETFIQVDMQGTGEITTVAPDGYVPPPAEQSIFEFISALKLKIKNSNIAPKQKDKLLKRLDKVERNLVELKQKKPRIFNLLEIVFKKVLVKWSSYTANEKKMQEIINNIEKRL